MKRVSTLTITALVAITMLSSCFKNNNIEPPSNKNTKLKIENLTINNLGGTGQLSVMGYSQFEFLVEKSDPALPMDTIRFVDSFTVLSDNYSQNYNFDTPDKAKTLNYKFKLVIKNGLADAVRIGNLNYTWNDQVYFNKTIDLSKVDNANYTTLQTINF